MSDIKTNPQGDPPPHESIYNYLAGAGTEGLPANAEEFRMLMGANKEMRKYVFDYLRQQPDVDS